MSEKYFLEHLAGACEYFRYANYVTLRKNIFMDITPLGSRVVLVPLSIQIPITSLKFTLNDSV